VTTQAAPLPVSLRIFVAVSVGFCALRTVSAAAWLLFGPGFEGRHATAEGFFLLSKAFLGGLFWFISLPIEGWRNPIAWLFIPWG